MTRDEKYQLIDALLLDNPTLRFVNGYIDDLHRNISITVDSKDLEIKQILEDLFSNIDLKNNLKLILNCLVKYGDAYSGMNIRENSGIGSIEILIPHYTSIITFSVGEESSKKVHIKSPFEKNDMNCYAFNVLNFSHDSIFNPLLEAKTFKKKINEYYTFNNLEINGWLIVEKINQQLYKLCHTHLISLGYKGDELKNYDIATTLRSFGSDSDEENLSDENTLSDILERLKNIEISIENLTKLDVSKIGQILNVNK